MGLIVEFLAVSQLPVVTLLCDWEWLGRCGKCNDKAGIRLYWNRFYYWRVDHGPHWLVLQMVNVQIAMQT